MDFLSDRKPEVVASLRSRTIVHTTPRIVTPPLDIHHTAYKETPVNSREVPVVSVADTSIGGVSGTECPVRLARGNAGSLSIDMSLSTATNTLPGTGR